MAEIGGRVELNSILLILNASVDVFLLGSLGSLEQVGVYRVAAKVALFMARLALLGALPLPLIFWAFGNCLLERIIGTVFIPALEPMFLLFFGQFFNATLGMASVLLIIGGKESSVFRFTPLVVGLNALLSLMLISLWGAIGAATANM